MIELITRNAGWKLFSLLVSLLLWFTFARDPEVGVVPTGASGCDTGTVRSRLHRARARLRRLLAPCWRQLRRGEEAGTSHLPSSKAGRVDAAPVSPKRSLP